MIVLGVDDHGFFAPFAASRETYLDDACQSSARGTLPDQIDDMLKLEG
jgi:hypothetical protein